MRSLLTLILSSLILLSYSNDENNFIDSVLQVANTIDDDKRVIEYLKIGSETRNSNIDTAYYYDSLALLISKKINNTALIVKSYNYLAVDYRQLGKLKIAENYFRKAVELAEGNNNPQELSMVYNNLGYLLDDLGNYVEALELFM